MKEISHTQHMVNLFMEGEICQSMKFEEIAHIMTLYGLETTESEAMDAYNNCMRLGYPRGGNPNAFQLVNKEGKLTHMTSESVSNGPQGMNLRLEKFLVDRLAKELAIKLLKEHPDVPFQQLVEEARIAAISYVKISKEMAREKMRRTQERREIRRRWARSDRIQAAEQPVGRRDR